MNPANQCPTCGMFWLGQHTCQFNQGPQQFPNPYSNPSISLPQQGWQCPVCKAVMGPVVNMCRNCIGGKK